MSISLKPWNQIPSIENGWVSGFIEADGGFYTNVGTGFKKHNGYYYFLLKCYITQRGEEQTLLHIRNLFGSTNALQKFRNPGSSTEYNRLEMTSSLCRKQIITYFSKFPLKGIKNIYYKR